MFDSVHLDNSKESTIPSKDALHAARSERIAIARTLLSACLRWLPISRTAERWASFIIVFASLTAASSQLATRPPHAPIPIGPDPRPSPSSAPHVLVDCYA